MNQDLEILDRLDNISVGPGNWKKLASQTTDKDYRVIVSYDNCTSYSQTQDLHACPRRYQLIKSDAKQISSTGYVQQENLDFAYGHSVGAGVQTLIATGSITAGLFAGFVSWKADYFADADDIAAKFGKRTRKNKSLAFAQLAIEKFHAQGLANDWEIATLSDGSPAVEIAFVVDFENGYKHYGHIDLLLCNKVTGKIAVWELKTTGFTDVDEAAYANSSQALSYGVVLDAIYPDLSEYDVIYAVYSSVSMEWQVIPFSKSLTQKMEWVQDVLLDHSAIKTYRSLNFFPKRGESCKDFNRRCKYFGTCDLTSHVQYIDLPTEREAENVNYKITLSEILAQQKEKQNHGR